MGRLTGSIDVHTVHDVRLEKRQGQRQRIHEEKSEAKAKAKAEAKKEEEAEAKPLRAQGWTNLSSPRQRTRPDLHGPLHIIFGETNMHI